MAKLPYDTHRNMIVPITNSPHIRTLFYRRYIKFLTSLKLSSKPILRTLYEKVISTTKSTTGRNVRKILIESNSDDIDSVNLDEIEYHPLNKEEEWKGEMVDHMMDALNHSHLDDEDRIWLEQLCSN